MTALAVGCGTSDELDSGAMSAGDESTDGDSGETDAGETDTGETDAGETAGDGDGDGIEIAGDWTDEWGSMHTISDTQWQQDADVYALTSFDNDLAFAVGQNGPDNAFNPDLWSRFDWAWVGTDLFYCQTSFDAASEADAESTARPDDTDPATGGCGGMFPWTKLN
jgi:hypothetical protein